MVYTKSPSVNHYFESEVTDMFCPNCGKQLPDTAKFCNGCGAQMTPSAPAEPVLPIYEEPIKPKAKKKFPTWIVIVALVLVVAIVAALVIPALDLGGGTASSGKSKDKEEDDDDKSSSSGKSMYALTEVTMYSYGELDIHVVLTYDEDGHLVQVYQEDDYGDYMQLDFSYDEKGYVSEKTVTTSWDENYTVEYTHELEDGLLMNYTSECDDRDFEVDIDFKYEDGLLVKENYNSDNNSHPVFGYSSEGDAYYTYNEDSLVSQLELYNEDYDETMIFDFSYNSAGKLTYAQRANNYGSTFEETWEYDDEGNLIPYDSDLVYIFDDAGNLTRIEAADDDSCYIDFSYTRLSANKHNRLANEFVKNLALGSYLEMPLFNSPYMLYFYDLFQEME